LELYRRAEAAAATESEQRDSRWGQLICAVELEKPEADDWLRALQAGVRRSDVKEVVRAAATGLSYQMNMGTLELTNADSAAELLDGVGDPMLVSAFLSGYSAALAFVGRYDEALEHATAFLAFIKRYRLDFARPHALCSVARALAGLRRWTQAGEHLTEAIRIARKSRDAYAQQVGAALQMRLLAQQARFQEALLIEIPVRSPLPSARAEVVLSRALVLASAGRTAEARSLVDEVRGLSHAVEPAVLAPAVEAICALRLHSPDAIEQVVELEQAAFRTGAVDILVTAYRSAPELLTVLLRCSTQQERVTGLIRAARDEDVARAVGQPIFSPSDPRQRLSRREREVYKLLAEGLTNREIAKLLFIEESTVKVHAHHIYEKLGLRSRTALAVQAILERADQATSAIDPNESADESS
jgi:DNA-binding NarL/FixJ family response regulator